MHVRAFESGRPCRADAVLFTPCPLLLSHEAAALLALQRAGHSTARTPARPREKEGESEHASEVTLIDR